jgi:hypothetical protein
MTTDNLADFKQALSETDELELTVTDAASGRETTRPVWFTQEGDMLYLLPVKGSASSWLRRVQKTPSIQLVANDVGMTRVARPITDPQRVRNVVDKFREKYGADDVKKYYSKFDVAVEVPLH